MTESQRVILHHYLQQYAHLSEADLQLAAAYWHARPIAKHNFFNFQHSVCRQIGFTLRGLSLSYIRAQLTRQDKPLI